MCMEQCNSIFLSLTCSQHLLSPKQQEAARHLNIGQPVRKTVAKYAWQKKKFTCCVIQLRLPSALRTTLIPLTATESSVLSFLVP